MKAPEILYKAAETYRERNAVYGDSYERFGRVMAELFPGGIPATHPIDFNRLGIIVQIVSKLTRYAANPSKPHIDSIHDICVYAAILEELDRGHPAAILPGDEKRTAKAPELPAWK